MKIILLVLFAWSTVYTQAQDTSACYFDALLSVTDKRNAAFNGKKTQAGEGWEAFALYPDGKTLMHSFYKDKKLEIKQGVYEIFYPDGKRKLAASFKNNMADGSYIGWHENGVMSDSGQIAENAKTGLWKTWYIAGPLESEGNYKTGSADGHWKWYHENGKPATIETYNNDKLKDLSCFDSTGKQTGFNCRLDKKPCPKNAYSFESYVIEHLLYPKSAIKKGIEGDVQFEFFVTKEGKLTRINFTNDSHPLLQEEIAKFLKAIPEWEPAISHNRAVDCLYTYQVPFNLPSN